jgi:hypothetical protein
MFSNNFYFLRLSGFTRTFVQVKQLGSYFELG